MKLALLAILLLLSACDDMTRYHMHAREYLVMQGVSDAVIERLIMQAALDAGDIDVLREYENGPVLYLVAANPGAPLSVLEELARHDDMEVRIGVAENPNTPPWLLLEMRTPGLYTAVNNALARNPRLPAPVLRDMFHQREALLSGFAMNPSTPPDIMRAIARDGEDLDRIWLAGNPNLPDDLAEQLAQSPSRVVRARMENRALQDPDNALSAH